MITDFDEIVSQVSTGQPVVWVPSGLPVDNSTLTGALTDEGTYCRNLQGVSTRYGSGTQQFLLKNSVYAGGFAAITNNNKITVKGSLRRGSGGPARGSIGLLIKATPTADGSYGDGFGGYKLRLGEFLNPNSFGTATSLRLVACQSNGNDGTIPQVNCGSFAQDAWVRCKMELKRLSTGEDELTAFTGAGALDAETWTQVGQLVIPPSANNYIPWGGSTRIGFYCAGDDGSTLNWTLNGFIDCFRADVRLA